MCVPSARGAIEGGGKISSVVPKYVAVFQEKMAWKDAEPVQFAAGWDTKTVDVTVPVIPQPGGNPTQPPQPGDEVVAGEKLKALPVLPQPQDPLTKHGRSVVMIPVVGQAPPPPPAPGQPVEGGEDMDWVTQLFTIDMAALAKAFEAAGATSPPLPNPPGATTLFLEVEMERQVMQPDGTWSEPEVVPKLETWRVNQPPPPFPAPDADRGVQAAYLGWATANTPDILQPLFYTTVPDRGDSWTKPGEQIVVENVFNPAAHVGGKGNLTDLQWKQVLQYRQEQYKLNQEQKRTAQPRQRRQPAGGAPEMMEGDMMNYAPRPPARRPPPRQAYDPAMPPDMMPEMMGEDMMMYPYGTGYGAAAVQQGLPQPGTDYPQGEFIPNDPQAPWRDKKVETWCHDANVEPGKTYRYRVRYKVKNPIFAAPNFAADPALAEEFAIVSPYSEWTSPTKIPELVNFFVATSKSPNANTVRFDVFTWDQGQTKQSTFTVGPGDLIGGVREGIDFLTKWTVVDFREDPRQNDWQIMLVNNEDGSIAVRSFKADQTDALYKGLKEQIKAAEAAEAALNPTAAANGGALR